MAEAAPVFSEDGRMQGNLTSAQGQPPAPPVPKYLQDEAAGQEDVQKKLDESEQRYQSKVSPLLQSSHLARTDLAQTAQNIPQQQPLPPRPDAQEYRQNAMGFASAMAVLGAVTSHFGRASGGQALAAFSGALNGWKEGNLQAYTQASQKWEQDVKATVEYNKQLLTKYDQILQAKNLNIDQQMAEIATYSAEARHDVMYQAARSNNFTMVAKIRDKIDEYTNGPKGLEQTASKLEATNKIGTEQLKQIAMGLGSGQIPMEIDPKTGQRFPEEQILKNKWILENYGPKTKIPNANQVAMQRFLEEHPYATAQEIQNFQQASHPPRSAAGMSVQKFMQENPHATSEEIQAFQARQAELSAQGRTKGTREANLDIILRVTDSAIPAAIEASEKVPRGSFVPLNQIIQKGKIATSDPALMQFGMANLQLAEGWARAMNPTGVMRESDRDKALSFLSTATSKETYKVLVEQLRTQIQRERAAIQSGTKSTISAPGEISSVSESSGEGWTDLGNGVRIREKP